MKRFTSLVCLMVSGYLTSAVMLQPAAERVKDRSVALIANLGI